MASVPRYKLDAFEHDENWPDVFNGLFRAKSDELGWKRDSDPPESFHVERDGLLFVAELDRASTTVIAWRYMARCESPCVNNMFSIWKSP